MKRVDVLGVLGIAVGASAVLAFAVAGAADDGSSDITTPPPGYRDWRVVSVAHEEGNQNDLRAILGNDVAIKAYREGTLPFPDGAIIARLAWRYTPSGENNKVFGKTQSFIAGAPTNVQFMVKDSAKYASTGGWGFAQFNEGKPVEKSALSACYGCHVPVQARDFVFTRYSP